MKLSEIRINETLVNIWDWSYCLNAKMPFECNDESTAGYAHDCKSLSVFRVVRKGTFPTDRKGCMSYNQHLEFGFPYRFNNLMVEDVKTGETLFTHSDFVRPVA